MKKKRPSESTWAGIKVERASEREERGGKTSVKYSEREERERESGRSEAEEQGE